MGNTFAGIEIRDLSLRIRGVVRRDLKLLDVVPGANDVGVLARALENHCLIRLGSLLGDVDYFLRVAVGALAIGDAHADHLGEGVARQLSTHRGIAYQVRACVE